MAKVDNGKLSEESNALMSNGQAENKGKRSISSFIYNKQNGTFLGRTAKAWVQLIVFYIIFYICLAAFWIACLSIFLGTLDDKVPKYYGNGTIIGINPGVGFQPLLKFDPESTLIKFNLSNPESYKKYVDTLDNYLLKYSNINYTRICKNGQSNKDVVNDSKITDENAESCRFTLEDFKDTDCTSEKEFGFPNGKPCIILSLNKLINWKPEKFEKNEIPEEISGRYTDYSITFHCGGIDSSDQEVIGNVSYYPKNGISNIYYPYALMKNYHQPFAMVQFTLPVNRIVLIKCTAYAKNIILDKSDNLSQLGKTKFELEYSK